MLEMTQFDSFKIFCLKMSFFLNLFFKKTFLSKVYTHTLLGIPVQLLINTNFSIANHIAAIQGDLLQFKVSIRIREKGD